MIELPVVVMGVAGCGKSSLGGALAQAEGAHLIEGDLYLADVACHPLLDEERCAELCEVVSHTLLELVEERPEMAELLPGRTFARTLH